MIILGLDLSLTSTGWVLLHHDGYLEASGSMRKGAAMADRPVARLEMFADWIADLLDDLEPDVVGLEGYSYGTRAGSTHAFAAGELGGLVKLAIARRGVELVIIPPATWKKALCGKGNLQKDQVRLELFKRYAIEFPSQDTLDAWAVAMTVYRIKAGLADKPAPKVRGRKPKSDLQPELLEVGS